MPTINVNGVPPGSGGGGGGGGNGGGGGGGNRRQPNHTYTGSVSDNQDRQKDFEAARKSVQRETAKTTQAQQDYDKALRQQSRDLNAQAAIDKSVRRQRETIWKQREAAERKAARESEAQSTKEIRERERQLNAEKRSQRDVERKRDRDQRAAERLEARQQQEALERGRQEWALRRTASHIRHRAGWDITPVGFRNIGHQGAIFSERVDAFERRWGRSPFGVSDIPTVTGSGLGTMHGAFRVQNIARLGSMGQRAAENRSWTELVKIEHELHRIERTTAAQLKFAKSPAEKAAVQRQENAILHARERIAAGGSGNSPAMNALGRVGGGLGLLLRNPKIDLAVGAITSAVMLPRTIYGVEKAIYSQQAPWINFKLNAAQIARGAGGGLRTSDLTKLLVNTGLGPSVAPGMSIPPWMSALGLGPTDALKDLNAFGTAPRNRRQAQGIITGIRNAFLMPGLGLSEDRVASLGATANTLGYFGNGALTGSRNYEEAFNKYFNKLAKVSESATAMGLDRSRVVQTIAAATMQNAQRGGLAPMAIGPLAQLWGRLASSGSPEMRSGEGVLSVLQGEQKTTQGFGIGGPAGPNLVFSSFLSRHGGAPKTQAQFAKQLQLSSDTERKLQLSPAAQQAWKAYKSAVQHGSPDALQFLGQYISSEPEAVNRIFAGSAYGSISGRPDLQARMQAGFENITIGQSLAYQSGSNPAGGSLGYRAMPSESMRAEITKAAIANGVPPALYLAMVSAESNFQGNNPAQVTGHGPMNVKTSIWTGAKILGQYYALYADVKDQRKRDLMAGATYNLGPGKGNEARIRAAINSGNIDSLPTIIPGKETAANDLRRAALFSAQDNDRSEAIRLMNKGASVDAANLQSSEVIVAFANTVDVATVAMKHFAEQIGAIVLPGYGTNKVPGGYMSNGAFVPGAAIPHITTHEPVK